MHKVFTSIQKELKIITKILVFGKSSSWVIFESRIMFSIFFFYSTRYWGSFVLAEQCSDCEKLVLVIVLKS